MGESEKNRQKKNRFIIFGKKFFRALSIPRLARNIKKKVDPTIAITVVVAALFLFGIYSAQKLYNSIKTTHFTPLLPVVSPVVGENSFNTISNIHSEVPRDGSTVQPKSTVSNR